ncbi:uncharacterized protein LOC62_02G003365 [Vanrija pseudolonga]|uniref:Uncharacterized protein n=1 Tax=Vanrija pseudolonga TaxID=143232 RepID=A0AAF0Y455_9TREE|nr:hypothetical protein LOC62_02G003365 [Vanrija pseudolonga]
MSSNDTDMNAFDSASAEGTLHTLTMEAFRVDLASLAHGFNVASAQLKFVKHDALLEFYDLHDDLGALDSDTYARVMPAIMAGHKAYLERSCRAAQPGTDVIDAHYFAILLVHAVKARMDKDK